MTRISLTLFNCAQFLLEIDIQGCGGHFFQCSLVVLQVLEPLINGLGYGIKAINNALRPFQRSPTFRSLSIVAGSAQELADWATTHHPPRTRGS